ncbi:DUF1674 domain-containing protein [Marinicauda sp. Alg238-R41]|uniref:DUF1674 domain-containing protein n=1 Tax=Marinicauda sp. Alg238-R41 TaxID=2993447 RepID=UPI0022E718D0|nr:DUF1674 domain-containing protein [Marinicauda sp. Alg238-R41]
MSETPDSQDERAARVKAAAERALAEAEARRSAEPRPGNAPGETEINGPAGPEPTRFGDWEKKGITYDF